jgi:hypothetical protein
MYELPADDIAMMSLSKSERVAFEKIESGLADLQRRAEAHEAFIAEALEKIERMELLARASGVRQ